MHDVILLAGGKGERMSHRSPEGGASELPKPLVPVKGKSILFHQIDYFLPHTKRIIISTGHRAQEIEDAVQSAYGENPPHPNPLPHGERGNILFASPFTGEAPPKAGVRVLFSREDQPLGTAGGIKLAASHATSDFVIVVNCDDITNISVASLNAITENTIYVAHPVLPFGLVEERGGFAVFKEKPTLPLWVNCGWYVLNRETILQQFPDKGSIEYDVFPHMKVRLLKHGGMWHPLTTKKDVAEFEKR